MTNASEQIDERLGAWIVGEGDVLWRIAYGDDTLRRYDARTGELTTEVEVPRPAGLLISDGRIWVGEKEGGGLRQHDAETLELLERTQIAEPGFPGPGTIREVNDWIWNVVPKDGTLLKVDPATGLVSQTVALDASPSDGLTYAAGRLWDAPDPDQDPIVQRGTLYQVDPATGAVETIILPAEIGDDRGIVCEVQGRTWLPERERLFELDPAGRPVKELTFDVAGTFDSTTAAEAFGDVWLITEGDGRVIRLPIDPFHG